MSLMTELRNPESRISRWFEKNMKPQAVAALVDNVNKHLANKLDKSLCNFDADPALAGTAFDYAFRWHVAPLQCEDLVAWHAALNTDFFSSSLALHLIKTIVEDGNRVPEKRAIYSVVLAHFEQVFRSGIVASHICVEDFPFAWNQVDIERYTRQVMDGLNMHNVSDVYSLIATINSVWGERLQQRHVQNPRFQWSIEIGGADGDWILGSTLYDCKCSWKRKPLTEEMLKQLVGYRLLMGNQSQGIDTLGFYFPRHRAIVEWKVDRLISNLDEKINSFYRDVIRVAAPRARLNQRAAYYFDDDLDDMFDFDFF